MNNIQSMSENIMSYLLALIGIGLLFCGVYRVMFDKPEALACFVGAGVIVAIKYVNEH